MLLSLLTQVLSDSANLDVSFISNYWLDNVSSLTDSLMIDTLTTIACLAPRILESLSSSLTDDLLRRLRTFSEPLDRLRHMIIAVSQVKVQFQWYTIQPTQSILFYFICSCKAQLYIAFFVIQLISETKVPQKDGTPCINQNYLPDDFPSFEHLATLRLSLFYFVSYAGLQFSMEHHERVNINVHLIVL